jgi:glycosyltransferase involved in cell wall biosynthesis
MNPEGMMLADIEKLGLGELRSYPLTSFYDLNMVKQVLRFASFLRREKIEIVQTHDFYTNVFGMLAAWIARVPVRIAARRDTTGWRTPLQLRVEHFIYGLSHAIVANAEAVRRQLLKEGVDNEKIVTIYNGLDTDRLVPKLKREESLRLFDLPAGGDHKFVVIVANLLHPVKDYPTFLRAAQIVQRAIPEARFVSAGVGPLTEEMRSLAAQLGLDREIFFLGLCERVAELLSVAEVCVLSSKAEGFSNSIIEYMAAGRPAVVTDVGGAREAVTDGETGFLVNSGDYESMAARIIELLRDPERSRAMGRRARQLVERKFSCAAQLESTELLYERLLRRPVTGIPEANRGLRQKSAEWMSE